MRFYPILSFFLLSFCFILYASPLLSQSESKTLYSDLDYKRDSLKVEKMIESYLYYYKKVAKYDSMLLIIQDGFDMTKVMMDQRRDSFSITIHGKSSAMIGFSKSLMGDFEDVEKHHQYGINLLIEEFGPMTKGLLDVYTSYANYFAQKGDFAKADEYLEKEILILKHHRGENHPSLAGKYFNKGFLYEQKKNYNAAGNYYSKAAELFLKYRPSSASKCLDRLGVFAQQKGDFDKAIQYFKQMIALREKNYEPDHIQMKSSNLRMAAAYLEKGEEYMAQKFFSKVKPIEEIKTIGRYYFNISSNYSDLGDLYLEKQDFANAEKYYFDLLKIEQVYSGAGHFKVADVQRKLGKLYLAQNNFEQALSFSQQSLKTLAPELDENDLSSYPSLKRTNIGYILPELIALKADIFIAQHQIKPDKKLLSYALKGYQLATDYISMMRSDYLKEGSKETLVAKTIPIFRKGLRTSMNLYNLENNRTFLDIAFSFIEKSKSILLFEAIQKSEAAINIGVAESILQEEAKIKSNLSFYERKFKEATKSKKKDTLKIKNYQELLFSYQNQYDQFVRKLKSQHKEYYELNYESEIATIQKIQSRLASDEALVEYMLDDDNIWIFYISSTEVTPITQSRDSLLSKQIIALRAFCSLNPSTLNDQDRRKSFTEYIQTSTQLYNTLLEAVLEKTSAIKQLTIIPDGQLGYLPFEILITEKIANPELLNFRNLPYLIKDKFINYDYSASIYLAKNENKSSSSPYTGFAPIYSDQVNIASRGEERSALLNLYKGIEREGLSPLKFNIPEIQRGKAQLGGNEFIGSEATEDAFKKYSTNSQIIHLAMHALVNDIEPMYSKLIFADKKDSLEDGNLFAYELYNMKFNADLAILSACNTGVGQIKEGEGIYSLARAFKYAGCPNIIMSLWKVNDKTTGMIMEDILGNLHKKEKKGEALQKAKLNHLANADQNLTHPYYWASFVLIGNNNPIILSKNYLWIIGGFSLLLVLFFLLRKTIK